MKKREKHSNPKVCFVFFPFFSFLCFISFIFFFSFSFFFFFSKKNFGNLFFNHFSIRFISKKFDTFEISLPAPIT